MSRTKRRQSGDRPWLKPEVEFEYIKVYKKVLVNVNEEKQRLWFNEGWWRTPKPEDVYKNKLVPYYIQVPISRPVIDKAEVLRCESDKGNWTPSRTYKELLRSSNRAKQRTQLHKVKESARNLADLENVHDYDPSRESATQRNLIWAIW